LAKISRIGRHILQVGTRLLIELQNLYLELIGIVMIKTMKWYYGYCNRSQYYV